MQLSRRVQKNPEMIDSSLQKLNCVSQNIVEVDIHPTVLSLLTSVAPDEVRAVVAGLPQQKKSGDAGLERGGGGMNTALAFSLRTVLLSRNKLRTTLGLVQFKQVVRLSLLGNKIERIEDCEALSLLPALQFLSLEFNPVTLLPHYRAHILRICAWPDTLNAKNCRLRKLDAQSVSPAEVERAAQCLQREKVTMGELVNRMRFLALLIEAEKRIALHHELRRRGVLLKDTSCSLTVENVVLRCSAQVLLFVDVGAASHLARRLMSGKCRMCAIDSQGSFLDDSSEVTEMSRLTTFAGPSFSNSNLFSLQNSFQDDLKVFCKDWSRDVFRRAISSLDSRICELLLSIAHSLGEELTVVDVDHLNKLWFSQAAKADKCHSYKIQNCKTSCMADGTLSVESKKKKVLSQERNNVKEKPKQEEIVRIALSPSETSLKSLREKEKHSADDVSSLCNISFISSRLSPPDNQVESDDLKKPTFHLAPYVAQVEHGAQSPCDNSDRNGVVPNGIVGKEFTSEDELPELPLAAPVPFSTLNNDVALREKALLGKLRRHVLRVALRRWQTRAWRLQQQSLCVAFFEEHLKKKLRLSISSLHRVSTILHFLLRTDQKRVLFHFWRERARMSYAPRSFRLMQLLTQWRRQTHFHRIIGEFSACRRARTLAAVWIRWHDALRNKRVAIDSGHVKNDVVIMEGPTKDGIEQAVHGVHNDSGYIKASMVGETPFKKLQKDILYSGHYSSPVAATGTTQGLTCSTKPSVDAVDNVLRCSHAEASPTLFRRLSLPAASANVGASPSSQLPSTCEKGTQTSAEPSLPVSSYDDLAKGYKDAVCADARKVVEAVQADRLRLVDRLIALEQRANAELVRAQHQEEEIRELRQKLAAMAVREECMNSALADKQRETEHLRTVIQALREERRELLRPSL